MLNVIGFQFLQWQTDVYYILKHLVKSVLQKPFYLLLINTKIINQYHITYTLYSGLNHVNYLNIIKRDHVSATVRTRLHLASGWSLDHSGAQYSYVGVRTRVGCRHMISFYNIPPIISVFKLQSQFHCTYRVYYAQHCNSAICEHSHPHICESKQSKDHY